MARTLYVGVSLLDALPRMFKPELWLISQISFNRLYDAVNVVAFEDAIKGLLEKVRGRGVAFRSCCHPVSLSPEPETHTVKRARGACRYGMHRHHFTQQTESAVFVFSCLRPRRPPRPPMRDKHNESTTSASDAAFVPPRPRRRGFQRASAGRS